MPNRSFNGSDGGTSTLRQFKVLVFILVFSNVALGGFGFYFLRAIDRKYSTLIDQTVPTLNDLQALTAVSVGAMRNTNPALFGESPQSRTVMVHSARLALEREHHLRSNILKQECFSRNPAERLDFQNAGDMFSRTATEIVGLLESGEINQAGQRREQALRPAFDYYIEATTKAADVLEAESLRARGTIRAKTGNISNVMLGLASWPLMILGVFLLITFLFVIAVLLHVCFRGREAM